MITYSTSEIEKMIEEEKFSIELKEVLQILMSAINDWSLPLDNLYDYDFAVQNLIRQPATKTNIEFFLMKADISKQAWEAESLSSLIEVYDYFDTGISLKQILDIIAKQQSPR